MNRLKLKILVIALFVVCAIACKPPVPPIVESPDGILINQLGYALGAQKLALIRFDADKFVIRDANGEFVFEGETGEARNWKLSGDAVRVADFSALNTPGEYVLCVDDSLCSYSFQISKRPYTGLADASLKSYYYARCGVDIDEQYGGKWNWQAGHPDTDVKIHTSAADKNRPEGTSISSPGGWYDAGDYGKYIVNSSITTWTLLQSLALNEEYHKRQNLNIPESGNELPDILDECLVNLKWMMTMQDPNDGGLYHKLTTKSFDGFLMPAETSKQRYVVQKSTTAALDYTATMAFASRLLKSYGLTDLAEEMNTSAKRSWQWALDNPEVFYIQPEDISTGAYNDTSMVDEWFWAAAEMYVLNGDESYKQIMAKNYQKPITPKWDVVNTLGIISLITSEKQDEFPEIHKDFMDYADLMLEKEKHSPYVLSLDKFAWGSNSDVANDGMLKLIASQLSGDSKYKISAQNDLDYILGRNATGYSFVTGFGSKTPMVPHNRIMSSDGVEEPIPGYIVGGPNTIVLNDCGDKVVRSKYPAASYTDTECSFSTNETAINWNAPLVFLVSAIDLISE